MSYYKMGDKRLRVELDTHNFYLFFYPTTQIADEDTNVVTLSDGVNVIEFTVDTNSIRWLGSLEESYPERLIKCTLEDRIDPSYHRIYRKAA